ncbi:type II toxin-antitoxin system YafQ family toxin [bacterium]|nr:type II toxin-antitoxin system YafQ family toxin [bacterium]
MLKIYYTKKIKKDIKLLEKRKYNFDKLSTVIDILATEKPLPEKYKDHALIGNYKGYRECHIEPDWLLIYKIENDILTLVLSRTGTHGDLF